MKKTLVKGVVLFLLMGILCFSLNVLAQEKEEKNSKLDFRFSVSKAFPEQGDKVFFKIQAIAGGNAPYKYLWKMNGGKISEKEKSEYTFSEAGEFQLEVQIRDRLGNVAEKKMKFKIREKEVEKKPEKKKEPVKVVPPLKCSIEGRINAMPGDTLFWEAKVEGGEPPYRYEWVLSRSGVISRQDKASHNFPQTARFNLTLRVWDSKETKAEVTILIVVKQADGSWPPPGV